MQRLSIGLLLGSLACDGGTTLDTAHDHTHGDTESCDDGSPVDAYVAGIAKTGANGVTVAIVSADPAPPDVGINAWTLEVTDAAGAPLADGSVLLTPFMPLHGHGTTPEDFSATSNGDGTWAGLEMDLFMPGLWEITVDATDASMATDSVVFRFCLEG